jgi:DNA topoisomerase-1
MSDPVEAAKAAKLRYVNDTKPGIKRKRAGRGFTYIGANGKRITDEEDLERIKALAIPPAWTEVWICPFPNGHIQATGRDEKGRKQYCYHERWGEQRNLTKFSRMVAFGEALPAIRAKVRRDLSLPGLPREKVLATVVRLLEATLIRVGNPEYVRMNQSFGLTTLRDRHVEISGSKLHFQFHGKSGKNHVIDLQDKRLAKIVKRCRDLPGYELFQYLDDDGERQSIESADVNDYLRESTGEEFSAKDFRTWAGTLLALNTLQQLDPSDKPTKKNVVAMIKQVAEQLGNTPAVARSYYVHPGVIEAYLMGELYTRLQECKVKKIKGLHPDECVVIALLQRLEG